MLTGNVFHAEGPDIGRWAESDRDVATSSSSVPDTRSSNRQRLVIQTNDSLNRGSTSRQSVPADRQQKRCTIHNPTLLLTYPCQLSLAIPTWVCAMSTSDSWGVNRHITWSTSPVSVVWQCKPECGWGLRKQRSVLSYRLYSLGRTLCLYATFYLFTCILAFTCWRRYRNFFRSID